MLGRTANHPIAVGHHRQTALRRIKGLLRLQLRGGVLLLAVESHGLILPLLKYEWVAGDPQSTPSAPKGPRTAGNRDRRLLKSVNTSLGLRRRTSVHPGIVTGPRLRGTNGPTGPPNRCFLPATPSPPAGGEPGEACNDPLKP